MGIVSQRDQKIWKGEGQHILLECLLVFFNIKASNSRRFHTLKKIIIFKEKGDKGLLQNEVFKYISHSLFIIIRKGICFAVKGGRPLPIRGKFLNKNINFLVQAMQPENLTPSLSQDREDSNQKILASNFLTRRKQVQ